MLSCKSGCRATSPPRVMLSPELPSGVIHIFTELSLESSSISEKQGPQKHFQVH